jgi:hypothetical protein
MDLNMNTRENQKVTTSSKSAPSAGFLLAVGLYAAWVGFLAVLAWATARSPEASPLTDSSATPAATELSVR